jgi:hypothetical protein
VPPRLSSEVRKLVRGRDFSVLFLKENLLQAATSFAFAKRRSPKEL